MKPSTVRKLHAVHRWLGVFISVNLLFLCITGIILVFHHEIDELLGDLPVPPSAGAAPMSTSELLEAARRQAPGHTPLLIGWAEDHPGTALVITGKPGGSRQERRVFTLNTATGESIGAPDQRETFTGVVLDLHAELMLGQPGRLYIGFVGVVFLVVLILGFLLYGPFMKRLAFGFLRRGRAAFTSADLHKSLGAATFAWNLVVALTGIILVLGSYLVQHYLNTELRSLRTPPSGRPLPPPAVSVEDAIERAAKAAPNMRLERVALPGHDFSGDEHYMMLFHGTEGVGKRLLSIVLVNAATGEVAPRALPWYVKLLLLSEPLHFGDYGGLPLKLLWVAFSVVTIVLIVSGFYVWARRRLRRRREEKEVSTDLPTGVVEVAE